MLKAREAVLRLKEYHPPLGGRAGLRLDFNENTAGCSPRVLAKLRALTAEELATYPEREPVERLAAEFLGAGPGQVLLTNGVDEAIHLLCETFLEAGDEALFAVPTFAMYEVAAGATGATVVTVPYDDGFAFPAERLLSRIGPRTRLIAVANPNNPTGTTAGRADLLRIAEAAPGAAVLVDEAYFDFHGQSVADRIERVPNLFVARTFSKAYGLAGLRVGVLAGAAEPMRWVRRVASPYNVNGVALACLAEALADGEYVRGYVAEVQRGREQLQARLAELGVPFWPSEANFVLARVGAGSRAFVAAMRARGILVRDRNSDPGCSGCVRITVGTGEQTARLLEALPECLGGSGRRAAREVTA